jgi:hypothetical protein
MARKSKKNNPKEIIDQEAVNQIIDNVKEEVINGTIGTETPETSTDIAKKGIDEIENTTTFDELEAQSKYQGELPEPTPTPTEATSTETKEEVNTTELVTALKEQQTLLKEQMALIEQQKVAIETAKQTIKELQFERDSLEVQCMNLEAAKEEPVKIEAVEECTADDYNVLLQKYKKLEEKYAEALKLSNYYCSKYVKWKSKYYGKKFIKGIKKLF